MPVPKTEQPSFHAHLIDKDTICFIVPDGAVIDVNEVEEMHRTSLSFFEDRSYCVLFKAENGFTVTPEAQQLGKEARFQKQLIAQAILINSLATRIIGNFIIRINQRPSVNKLFTDEKEAIAWLKDELKKFSKSVD